MKPTKQAHQLRAGDVLEDGRTVKDTDDHVATIDVIYTDGRAETVSFCKIYYMKKPKGGDVKRNIPR
jgi:hypothetical protein